MEKKKYVDKKWYAAYAVHTWATPEHVMNIPFDTFAEADAYAKSFLCDDDNAVAYYYDNGVWYKLCRY